MGKIKIDRRTKKRVKIAHLIARMGTGEQKKMPVTLFRDWIRTSMKLI